MSKQLYLLRHAEALDKSAHQADKDRQLTTAGVQQGVQVGAYLLRENFALEAIFSSTAERAGQTAGLVADTIKLEARRMFLDDELYDASVRTFFAFLNKLDNAYHHVMCVGHNPTLSYLAEYLTQAEIGEMSPGGLAIISFKVTSWADIDQGNGELLRYVDPASLQNNGTPS
jgi:phosphohistidine phosphatase